jgi:hypothetical protein
MLIGLNGYKGVGKDTVGKILAEQYGYERLAFADKMKEAIAALFDISREDVDAYKIDLGTLPRVEVIIEEALPSQMVIQKSFSWREFLQRFGTEMGREVFGEDFWVDLLLPDDNYGQYDSKNIVVTDVRFPNEYNRIKSLGGYNVRVLRPDYEGDGHASEARPDPELIDYYIHNDGDLDLLRDSVEHLLMTINGSH